jgi:hypothetical protein
VRWFIRATDSLNLSPANVGADKQQIKHTSDNVFMTVTYSGVKDKKWMRPLRAAFADCPFF